MIVGDLGHLQIRCWPGSGHVSWWRHLMETSSAILAHCAGNSPVTGEFPAHRPVARSFDVFFGLRLNKRLSKQPWGWWFATPALSLWRHCNVFGTDPLSICRIVEIVFIQIYIFLPWSRHCLGVAGTYADSLQIDNIWTSVPVEFRLYLYHGSVASWRRVTRKTWMSMCNNWSASVMTSNMWTL